MKYLVKEYKIFGKYDVEIWIDDIEVTAEKIIETPKRVIIKTLPRKTAEKYLKLLRSGKIKPLFEYVTDLDL